MTTNRSQLINESLDPRFGKTSPQKSLLKNAVKVINSVAVIQNNVRQIMKDLSSVKTNVNEIKKDYITDDNLKKMMLGKKLKWYEVLFNLLKFSAAGIFILAIEHYNDILNCFSHYK